MKVIMNTSPALNSNTYGTTRLKGTTDIATVKAIFDLLMESKKRSSVGNKSAPMARNVAPAKPTIWNCGVEK